MDNNETLAKEMFEAYNAQGPNPNKTWDGKDVPPWEKLGEQVTGKWVAAALVAKGPTAPNPEWIARVCHEVNRAYCQSIGDDSQAPWSDAPQWQKDSAINGVKSHMRAARSPRESHELWLAEKRATGWKFGPVKDANKKEHPCFVPYDELPERQRSKDYIFAAIVHSLA